MIKKKMKPSKTKLNQAKGNISSPDVHLQFNIYISKFVNDEKDASFDFQTLSKFKRGIVSQCCMLYYSAYMNNPEKLEKFVEIAQIAQAAYFSNNESGEKFLSCVEELYRPDLERETFDNKDIDWNKANASGALLGSLYNKHFIQDGAMHSWLLKLMNLTDESDDAVMAFLFLFSRVTSVMKFRDPIVWDRFMLVVGVIKTKESFKAELTNANSEAMKFYTDFIDMSFPELLIPKLIKYLEVSEPCEVQKFASLSIAQVIKNPEKLNHLSRLCSKLTLLSDSYYKIMFWIEPQMAADITRTFTPLKPDEMWSQVSIYGETLKKITQRDQEFGDQLIPRLMMEVYQKYNYSVYEMSQILNLGPLSSSSLSLKFNDVNEKLFRCIPWLSEFLRSRRIPGKIVNKCQEEVDPEKIWRFVDFKTYGQARKKSSNVIMCTNVILKCHGDEYISKLFAPDARTRDILETVFCDLSDTRNQLLLLLDRFIELLTGEVFKNKAKPPHKIVIRLIGALYNAGIISENKMQPIVNILSASMDSQSFDELAKSIEKTAQINFFDKAFKGSLSPVCHTLQETKKRNQKKQLPHFTSHSDASNGDSKNVSSSSSAGPTSQKQDINPPKVQPKSNQLTTTNFKNFLKNIRDHEDEKLLSMIEELKKLDPSELDQFAEIFFYGDAIEEIPLLVTFAQRVDLEIQKSSFKESLIFQLDTEVAKNQENKINLIAQVGEFYSIGWLDDDKLENVLNLLLDAGALEDLYYLLQRISLKIISERQTTLCDKILTDLEAKSFTGIYRLLHRNVNEFVTSIKSLIVPESKENSNTSTEKDEMHEIDVLISMINSGDESEFDDQATQLIDLAIESQENLEKSLKAVEKIENSDFKEIFLNHLQDRFLDTFGADEISTDESSENLVELIANLYRIGFTDNTFLSLILDILFDKEKSSNVAVDCIKKIFEIAGGSMKRNKLKNLKKFIEFFNFVVESENDSYRSKIYKEVIAIQQENEKISKIFCIQEAEVVDLKKISENPAKNIKKCIESFWEKISQSKEKIRAYAEVCSAIAGLHQEVFNKVLRDFLMEKIEADFTQNQILLIIELYNKELVTSKIFYSCINLEKIKNFSSEIVEEFRGHLSENPNIAHDVHLNALIYKLQDIENEKSEEVFQEIKKDIADLSELFRKKSKKI